MAIQSLRALPEIGLKSTPEGTTLYNASWKLEYTRQIRLDSEKKNPDEDLISKILEIEGVVSLIVTKKISGINVVLQKRDDISWDPIMKYVSLLLKETRGDTSELLVGSAALTR